MSPSKLPPQYAVRPQPPLPPPHQQLKQMQRQKSATQTPQPHTTTVVGAQPQRLLPVPSPQMIHGAGPSPYPAHTSILPPGVQFPPVPGIGPPFSHPTTFPTGSLPFGQSPIGGSASQPGSYPSTPMHGFPHFGQQRPGMLPPGFPSLHGYGAGPSGLAHAMSFSSPQATPGAPGYAPFGTPGHPGMASLSMDQDVPPPEEVQAQAPPPALRPASYFAQIINPVVPWALNGIRRPHAIPFFLIDVQWRQVGAPRTLEKYTAEIVHETIVVDSSRLKQHMIRVRKGQHVATRRRQPGKLELASVKIRFVLREFDDPDAQTPISERPKSNGPGGEDDNNSIECLNAQDPAEHRNKLDFLVNVMQDGAQVGKLRRGVIEAPGEINGTHEKVERDGVQNSWASIVFEPKLKVGLNTMDIDVEPSPPCPELCALIVDESAPVELRDRAKVLKLLKERYRLFLYV
ncbi:hypothetical protein K437DRAFT_173193 [Tilletiaria anomala UBC 951]|uniref:Uncharacterized protein n=1 Tax=Tilletiaria anomala (strain ATCC 24038 / CBS 436.72 / UBC 951) TaxID=1037660 RepID=A0A066WF25_TILAU|nr:uncharacterized protein K437DRAFT_173193 [Tilletiaria anomala UBC 951]KDN52577.1 hypothetical protein K437DRAFT_173193 [Tilletiaria anomala UBC 951]